MTSALLIDIGNSRIKWRRVDLARPPPSAAADDATMLDEAWRGHAEAVAAGDAATLAARWSADDEALDAAWISNVASPAVGDAVADALRKTWPTARIEWVGAVALEGDVVNDYAEPTRLGADRWMAAIAAHALLPAPSLLVCSFGTATTIDLVICQATAPQEVKSANACFVGGLILPGPETMRAALVHGTARLPDIAGRVVDFADNTADAIASGIVAAQVGAVSRALAVARRRVADRPLTLMCTGGAASSLLPFLGDLGVPSHVVEDLVLRGLAIRARAGRLPYDANATRFRVQPTNS